jgi:uncharacterized protein (TIGR02270 family)
VTEGEPRPLLTGHVVAPLGPDEVDPAQSEDPPRTYFEWQLRQEHLEETASLYYQRRTILHDPEVEWPRVGEAEQRILNHVDAVVAGGATSIWAVASGLLAEEEGLCFAGALVLAVLPDPKNFDRMEATLAQPAASRVQAIQEALRHVRPAGFLERLTAWLAHEDLAVQAMAISLLGELQLGEPALLYRFLQSDEPLLVRRASQALRRRGDVYATSEIERLLRHRDPTVVHEAALAAICLGSRSAPDACRQFCRQGAPPETRAAFLLALGGNLRDLDVILRSSPSPPGLSPEVLSALGILGCVESVDYLLSALRAEDDAVKLAAAEALDLITGAKLREEAAVPDPDAPDLKDEVVRVCTAWQT